MRLIDRDVLLKKAKQEQRFYKDEYDAMESGYLDEEREIVREAYFTMTDCVSLINNAPIVDAVEVVHGEWIFSRGDGKTCVDGWTCSACGNSFHTNVPYFEEFHFCPNCGAKMDGEREC